MIPALQHLLPAGWGSWIELALATPVVLWAGLPFFERGWRSIVTRNLNMFTLIALGVGAAYGYSVVATLFPGIFPPVTLAAKNAKGERQPYVASRQWVRHVGWRPAQQRGWLRNRGCGCGGAGRPSVGAVR